MALPAGALRQRVTIERLKPQSTGRLGEQRQTPDRWAPWQEVWASVQAVSGREVIQSDRTQALVTYTVRVRTREGLTPRDRLRWKGLVLNIVSIQLRGLRLEEQEILCSQEVD